MDARRVPWLVASGALVLVLAVTHRYPLGVSFDSVAYAGAASSLIERGRLDVPLTWWDSDAAYAPLSHFPPALPVILAAVGRVFGLDPYTGARWLNAACIFGTVLVAAAPVADSALALLVLSALLAGPSFIAMHLWLWSEPLFLLLVVVAVRLGVRARAEAGALRPLILLGLCCGVATLTRYAGASLFVGFIILIATSKVSRAERVRRLLWYGGTYLATVLPWLWWLSTTAGAPRPFEFVAEDPWTEIGRPIARIVVDWFLPASLPLRQGLAIFATALVALALRTWRARTRDGTRIGPTAHVTLVLLAVHVAFLVSARLFADPAMPFDERILSTAMILTAIALAHLAKAMYGARVPVIAGMLAAGVAFVNVVATAPHVLYAVRHGHGYSSADWAGSETIAWLRHASPGLTIFSNAPDVICARLPVTAKYTPAHYEAERLAEFTARVGHAAPAVVVLFDDPHVGWMLARKELVDLPGRDDTRTFPDAVVLGWGRTGLRE